MVVRCVVCLYVVYSLLIRRDCILTSYVESDITVCIYLLLHMSYSAPQCELHNIRALLISYRSFGRLHSTSLALLCPRLVLQLPPVAPMFSLTHSFEPPFLSLCQHQTALQVSHLTYARYNHKRFNDNYHTTAVGMELTTRLVAIDYYRRYKVQGA